MLFLAPAGAAALLVSPLLLPPYYLITLCYALVRSIACLGLNLLFGTTGLLSLGHAAYFGIGAYTGGFLYAFTPLASLELYVLAGVVAALALATAFGSLCVRAMRMHFTILTLALAQVVHALFIGGMAFRPFGGVGKGLFLLGGGGLYLPRFTILGIQFGPEEFTRAFACVVAVALLGGVPDTPLRPGAGGGRLRVPGGPGGQPGAPAHVAPGGRGAPDARVRFRARGGRGGLTPGTGRCSGT